jgi:hypothetical protein
MNMIERRVVKKRNHVANHSTVLQLLEPPQQKYVHSDLFSM